MAYMIRALARTETLPFWLGLAAAMLALAVAHLAQYQGLVPCALCYVERWPYRIAALLALLGLALPTTRRATLWLLVAALLAGAAIAAVHVGVELQWWKSPLPECAAPILRTGSIGDLLASMPAHPAKPCDDPTYLIPGLRLSMAQLNFAYALASAALVAISARWIRT